MTRYKHKILGFLFAAAICSTFIGCKETSTRQSTSTSELLKGLANLKGYALINCKFTIESERKRDILPAPSDFKVIIRGYADLSQAGMLSLKNDYSFEPIDRNMLPVKLNEIVPPGKLLYSKEFNNTFSSNKPMYYNGFVVIRQNDEKNRVYFLTTDLDHDLKMSK
ncbi:hypothetical protein STSP2_02496 [Anaerohalosphaera lusitana]|uniref:Lipoprotein n=1 Tax=Anaerohalosphaera lusitana TaxID=1936003 RepID=A0A1U9NNC9_9BACT|nr:hypothetical protein [Anaerohalosphaera lusitana]AQT69307.1 hypothetical protein STSP2_02496 [Anaerohalosphaera lusitana]